MSDISGKDWPAAWPRFHNNSTLVGLGLVSNLAQISKMLTWKCAYRIGTFKPYIISSFPLSLCGSGILGEMKVNLMSDENWNDQHFL